MPTICIESLLKAAESTLSCHERVHMRMDICTLTKHVRLTPMRRMTAQDDTCPKSELASRFQHECGIHDRRISP